VRLAFPGDRQNRNVVVRRRRRDRVRVPCRHGRCPQVAPVRHQGHVPLQRPQRHGRGR
jgi:hypothetical protein